MSEVAWALIDETHRTAYVPIPRSASTSILRAFERHFGLARSISVYHRRFPLVASTSWVAAHPDYLRWTALFPPWVRLASFWWGWIREPGLQPHIDQMPELHKVVGSPFREFIQRVCAGDVDDPHVYQATEFFTVDGAPVVDQIVNADELTAFWGNGCRNFGWPELLHENASGRPPWRNLFTADLMQVVKTYYAAELSYYHEGHYRLRRV